MTFHIWVNNRNWPSASAIVFTKDKNNLLTLLLGLSGGSSTSGRLPRPPGRRGAGTPRAPMHRIHSTTTRDEMMTRNHWLGVEPNLESSRVLLHLVPNWASRWPLEAPPSHWRDAAGPRRPTAQACLNAVSVGKRPAPTKDRSAQRSRVECQRMRGEREG